MKIFPSILVILLFILGAGWSPLEAALCTKNDSLFRIERSKNANIVQYDACLLGNGDLSESNPVSFYWVLESGKKEDLNSIEKKYAYGIELKKASEDKYEISFNVLKDRKILVERIGDDYKAVTSINGKPSILEKVYIRTQENLLGLPDVAYLDLYGRTLEGNSSVKERILS